MAILKVVENAVRNVYISKPVLFKFQLMLKRLCNKNKIQMRERERSSNGLYLMLLFNNHVVDDTTTLQIPRTGKGTSQKHWLPFPEQLCIWPLTLTMYLRTLSNTLLNVSKFSSSSEPD